MDKDFSIKGREKFLAKSFYAHPGMDTEWEFTFARWTLLERVIWRFKPDDTYCHLDGFDLDRVVRAIDGFVAIGRVWHLPEPGTPGDIPTVMAVEFNQDRAEVSRAAIWVGRLGSDSDESPKPATPDLVKVSSLQRCIGSNWRRAFFRDCEGWSLDRAFDLSIFLMERKGD